MRETFIPTTEAPVRTTSKKFSRVGCFSAAGKKLTAASLPQFQSTRNECCFDLTLAAGRVFGAHGCGRDSSVSITVSLAKVGMEFVL